MNAQITKLQKKVETLFLSIDGSQKQLALRGVKDSPIFLRELTTAFEDLEAVLSREHSRLTKLIKTAARINP